ncbi:condensation domain-containing protein [Pseudomonas sp. R1-1]|uniref:condensation domain-containing protein n=1 Tax=Pseudomonas sp. R1-1 TaxID=1602529 RepID=UPI003DA85175
MQPTSAPAADDLSVPCETFALTAAQRDIWLDQLSRGDSPLYNIGGYVELDGPLDQALMQAALESLIARHDALRTVLLPGVGEDGMPRQAFAPTMAVAMPLFDFSGLDDAHAAAQALLQQQMEQVYRLDGQPLLRFSLIRLDEGRHWLEDAQVAGRDLQRAEPGANTCDVGAVLCRIHCRRCALSGFGSPRP